MGFMSPVAVPEGVPLTADHPVRKDFVVVPMPVRRAAV